MLMNKKIVAKYVVLTLALSTSVIWGGTVTAQDITISTDADYTAAAADATRSAYGNIVPMSSTTGNAVTIGTGGGGTVPMIGTSSSLLFDVMGGSSTDGKDVTNNAVVVNSGQMHNVMGGYVTTGSGNANGNHVTVNDGTIAGDIIGGQVSGGTGAANHNTVVITGGTIGGWIIGGESDGGAVSGNAITLDGVTSYGVFGGYNDGLTGSVTGNTVNLVNHPSAFTFLEGGSGGSEISVKGNILNVYVPGNTTGHISDFSKMNFYLTTKGSTMLTISGDRNTDLSGTTIRAGMLGGMTLAKGDTVTLLADTGSGSILTTGMKTGNFMVEGASLGYGMDIAMEGNDLVATLTNDQLSIDGQTKSLVETRMAELSFINSAADLAAGVGMNNALAITDPQDVFVAASVQSLRNKTGSYVDSKGASFELGYAKKIKKAAATLLIAPFLEYGTGHYDSYLEDTINVHGYGREHYIGAGILLRQDQTSGLYYEGSLRAGRLSGNYESSDMANSLGLTNIKYDTSATYYAAHLGIGKILGLKGGDSMDLYGKYFYSHLGSDSTTLNSGETYEFEAVNSNRIRLGGRYIHPYSGTENIYAGLGVEHEFSGSAQATYKAYNTASPTMKGTSGLIELGWQMKPSEGGHFYTDLGLTGWVGRQRGITFNANLGWKF